MPRGISANGISGRSRIRRCSRASMWMCRIWPGPGPAGSYVAPWKFKDFDHDPDVPDQHIEDRMAKEAVAWMEKHKDEPFYLNYWMFSVHAPFDAKKALIEKYRARVNPADPQRSPTYAAMVESMDDAIGTLLDALDRLKLADRTIIIFTADNGGNMYNEVDGTTPTSNAPLRGGKATMFEGGTRVPCVIAWPGITAAGTRSDAIDPERGLLSHAARGLGLEARAGAALRRRQHPARAARAARSPARPSSNTSRTIPACPTGCRPPSPCIAATGSSSASSTAARRARIAICSSTCATTSARRTTSPRRSRNWCSRTRRAHREVPRRHEGRRARAESRLRSREVSPRTGRASRSPKPKPQPAGQSRRQGRRATPRCRAGRPAAARPSVKDGILTMSRQRRCALSRLCGWQAGRAGRGEVPRPAAQQAGPGKWNGCPQVLPAEPTKPVGGVHRSAGRLAGSEREVPATGPFGIVRVYLPAQQEAVEVDWMELKARGARRRWEFNAK